MNQLKSGYNIPFLDSSSHPIHTCLSMIANNLSVVNCEKKFFIKRWREVKQEVWFNLYPMSRVTDAPNLDSRVSSYVSEMSMNPFDFYILN